MLQCRPAVLLHSLTPSPHFSNYLASTFPEGHDNHLRALGDYSVEKHRAKNFTQPLPHVMHKTSVLYSIKMKSISFHQAMQLRATSARATWLISNKGRKWLYPNASLWTHESVLWNLVPILHSFTRRSKTKTEKQ